MAGVLSCTVAYGQSSSPASTEPATLAVNIERQTVREALRAFGEQTGIQVLFRSEGVTTKGVISQGVVGQFSAQEVLARLLANTGLKYEFVNAHTVRISSANASSVKEAADPDPNGSSSGNSQSAQPNESSATTPSVASEAGRDEETKRSEYKVEEVIVTAQKREERLQDVPVAMSVLDPQSLAAGGQNKLLDYFATVPGLSVSDSGFMPGTTYITIRGLSTGLYQNSTTATVIDDVPTGSGSAIVFGQVTAPDIDPGDLQRIEVLKGPQGTLYGADSLGGLVKYVTVDPSTSAFSGRVEAGGVDLPEGGLGYVVRASANIPVSDAIAIRASGFSRGDPGYAEDVTTSQNNINSAHTYGGRVAALWRPSNDISLKVSALLQRSNLDGPSYFNAALSRTGIVQPTLGYFKYTGQGFANSAYTQQQLYTATLKANIAGAELVSVSGYNINKLHGNRDYGSALDGIFHPPGQTVTGLGSLQDFQTGSFTQELRLSASVDHWLDWLVGGFYTHQSSPYSDNYQNLYEMNPATGILGQELEYAPVALNFTEYAVFGDVTIHLSDRFDVQLGGRGAWNKQTYNTEDIGPVIPQVYPATQIQPPDTFISPTLHASGHAFTYLVTPQFKISPNLMIYARLASGYRIGAPNANYGQAGVPEYYNPDTTTNYELGFKGEFLQSRLSVETSVYHISWHDFQIAIENPFYFETNAGDAKSNGVEVSLQAHPTRGLTLTAQGSYNHAVLTQNLPAAAVAAGAYGLSGTPLPYSIPWSGGVTVNQDIPFSNDWTGFVGGQVTYVGVRYGELTSLRAQFPAYTTVNLLTGVRRHSWLFNLYVDNVADTRGILSAASSLANGGYYGTITRPRTVGLNVIRNF